MPDVGNVRTTWYVGCNIDCFVEYGGLVFLVDILGDLSGIKMISIEF